MVGSRTSRSLFEEQGYLPPVRVFTAGQCRMLLEDLHRAPARPPLDWHKSLAAVSSAYAAVAADDRVLDLVTALIGDDVILWGASLVLRQPDQVHPWHTDIESASPTGRTVSVWIGLEHTSALSSLIVVPRSHRFGVTVQQVVQEEGRTTDAATDEQVSVWAKRRDERSGVVSLNSTDGEAVVFDGRLWHASHNKSAGATRCALLLQYASPETAIRIPNFRRRQWPFELYPSPRPACILVSGRAMADQNRIVPAPPAANGTQPSLSSRIHALALPLERDLERGFKPHPLFRGPTPNLRLMSCHVSVLDPGKEPHPPHQHVEEEILIVLDGDADLVFADATAPGVTTPHRASAGMFAYYPAGFLHTIRNPSSAPVTYLMFKWLADSAPDGAFQAHCLIAVNGIAANPDAASAGIRQEALVDGETPYLRKLHAHVTVLAPGGGYAPHVDAHDVGIVVLRGTVETLGERVGRHGLIFYTAGEPHGMTNVGSEPAVYVVFEFHGRHRRTDAPYDPRWSRRLLAVLKNPDRLKSAVRRRLGW
jgi:mannose-6-phosphate isomerase-like protein (cupin superfamily)/quercetin dioxygenase-like cupin family protein